MQTKTLSGTRARTASLRVPAAVLLVATLMLLFISAPSWAQADDTAVSNLTASSTSPGEIAIAWDAPSRAPGDYRLTWKKSSGKWPSYKKANTVDGGNTFPAGTSHTVSGMEEGTAYSVRVRARYLNSEGNVDESGPWTDSLQVTVASTPPPPATPEPTTPPDKGNGKSGGDGDGQTRSTNPPAKPQGLLAAAMHNSVSLFWDNPNDDSITGYQILRGPDAANLTVLTNDTGSTDTSYTDDTVTAETTYVYAVLARNANGLSAQSDATTANTPAAPVEPESARSIAGAEFTLDGKALDTTGTCSETDVASISDDCTINILIKSPVFAVVGTLDSNDRLTIKTGRDKAAVDAASNIADENDLRGTDQTVVLTFPEGMSLLRLWGDEDGTAGGGEEHFFQVNVELAASIEAVKSPVIEGEEEVQFRITLSSAAPVGGVDVMVELTQESVADPGPIEDDDYRVHTVTVAHGQTEAILEVLTSRNEVQSNNNQVNAEILSGTGYEIGTKSTAHVVVQDRDKVNLRFADGCGGAINVNEGDGTVSFDVLLDNPVAYDFTIVFSLVAGSAKVSNDYVGGIIIANVPKKDTRATVTITILEDNQIEETEYLSIWMLRNGLDGDILTPTCGGSNPTLRINIADNDEAKLVLTAPEEVTEGDPIRIGLGPKHNVKCPVQFPFETTLTITGATSQLETTPSTSETLGLPPCDHPQNVKIRNADSTTSEPVWQTIDRPGQQGDRRVTFTIGTLTSSDSRVSRLIPERRSATVTIKDKPNSKATGDDIIAGDAIVGEALTLDTSAISDSDGLTNTRFTYEWSKGLGTTKEDLSTESSYTVREDDIGDRIRLTVSFTDDEGFQEELTAVPTYAVLPYLEHYFGITEKSIGEPLSGTREIGTWVYINHWPMVRSDDGSTIQNWGVNPPVSFTIPYTVTYEDGAKAGWIEVEDVTFTATQSGSMTGFQGRSNLSVTIKQISKKVDKRQVPYGQDLGKIIITLDDGIDLPNNGPKLNVREGEDTLTITIVSNGK